MCLAFSVTGNLNNVTSYIIKGNFFILQILGFESLMWLIGGMYRVTEIIKRDKLINHMFHILISHFISVITLFLRPTTYKHNSLSQY